MAEIKALVRRLIVWILSLEARAVLKKYNPKVVLVTGSVGKTSAKDATYAALSTAHSVRKCEKSFNSDIGVPLTILGLPNAWSNPIQWFKNIFEGLVLVFVHSPYPKWLVLEVGADHPGDISRSLTWLHPYMVVATRFPNIPVHVEFYESPKDVVAEELAPVSWLSDHGVLVANADDERAVALEAPKEGKRITFGFTTAEVRATRYLVTSKGKMPAGISFDVTHAGERAHLILPNVIGKAHAYSVLAGIAAAVGVGVSLKDAAAAFAHFTPPLGRMHLVPGKDHSVIIDDSYNSSPVAVSEALHTLKDAPRKGKRIAVLGDMLELGIHSVPEHQKIGALAKECADILVTAGVRSKDTAKAAREAGMSDDSVIECDHATGAISALLPIVGEGDIILVKGSQSMRMERVVKALMNDPDDAKTLLVRQDSEWLERI